MSFQNYVVSFQTVTWTVQKKKIKMVFSLIKSFLRFLGLDPDAIGNSKQIVRRLIIGALMIWFTDIPEVNK